MKNLFTTILLLMAITLGMNAAKSTGTAHSFAQPDGTRITVKLLGDENFSWYETLDGVILSCVNNSFYVANITGCGTLECSGIIAHNEDARSAEETALAKAQDKDLFFSEINTLLAKSIPNYPTGKESCPHTGTIHVPIILMNYTDTTFTFKDKETWETYFNSTEKIPFSSATRFQGYGSVSAFFKESSNGKLNFVFDIYGPYTASHGHDYYGYNQGKSRELSLLTEGIKKADKDIDFSDAKYDSNNDGFVDMVYIVFAGTGRNLSAKDNDFHPSCWYGSSTLASADGMKINVLGAANELAVSAADNKGTAYRAGIGVICHEMSHGMGLPDLYWTSTTTPKDSKGYPDYNNCGPEDWDLMDGGENLYNGMWPCLYTAWERDIMGWIEPEELTEPQTVTLYPLNKEGGSACKITNPENKYEYYIIENYPYDEWNFYINNSYGSGLMITHLNASSTGFTMSPNITYGEPNITLLPADNFILGYYSINKTCQYKGAVKTITNDMYKDDAKGDPYVGSKYTGNAVTSVAAYKNYKGEDMVTKYPITDITRNEDGSITFKFMGGTPTSISAISDKVNENDNRIYTIDGRYAGTTKNSLPHGLYIQNGKKIAL